MQNSTSLSVQAKLLGSAYDIFALAATNIIAVVAVITWMSGNLGAENDDVLPP
jgi:hypothetical protein